MRVICATQEGYLSDIHYQDVKIITKAAYLSGTGLATAAFLFLLIGILLMMAGKPRFVKGLLLLLAVGELLFFARHHRPAFNINRCFSPALAQTFYSLDPDDRILHIGRHNQGMVYNTGDLWGYGPGVRRRYAELMFFAQGYDPREANPSLPFRKRPDLFSLLGCRAIIEDAPDGSKQVLFLPSPLPRAFLVESYKVIKNKDDILKYVTSPDFNPRREVVLESEPGLEPSASGAELSNTAVSILETTTDSLDIKVNTPQPAVLVVTDAFSRGWQAVSLEDPPIQEYVVMPADYALRAIPLQPGRHKIRLVYRPPLIKTGLMISVAGWVLFLLLGTLLMLRGAKTPGRRTNP